MAKIKKNITLSVAILMCSALTAGCSSASKQQVSAKDNNGEINNALAQSAVIIADAQRVIAASENAMRSMAMTESQREAYRVTQDYVPPGMEMPIPLYSNGELERAARVVAQMTNYEFEVLNAERKPREGVMVKVKSDGRAAYELIKDLGIQAGTKADVIVRVFSKEEKRTEKHGVVSVVYK